MQTKVIRKAFLPAVTLVLVLFSSCKTCKCPAYSYRAPQQQQQDFNSSSLKDSQASNLILSWNDEALFSPIALQQ